MATITTESKPVFTAIPRDASGVETGINGDPIWLSSDSTILALTPRVGTLIADGQPLVAGTVTITVTGKRFDGGIITGKVDVTIARPEAETIEIVISEAGLKLP